MRIEILSVGSELTRGDIANTNAAYISQKLFSLGYEIRRHVVIPDDLDLIVSTLQESAARADALLVTGGLGPTADDLTAEAAARAAGVPLERHAGVEEAVRLYFQKLGREMSPNNLRQALVPRGATVVVSPVGTAPAFAVEIGGCRAWFTAGVPREMRYLLAHYIIPDLLEARPPGRIIRERRLRCYQVAESRLDHLVRGAFEGIPGLEVGFKTEWPENVLLLFAQGESEEEAEARLREAEARARARVGEYLLAVDGETIAGKLAEALIARSETVALAETDTGGAAAALLMESPRGAEALAGGLALSSRSSFLQVPEESLRQEDPASEEAAKAMAEATRRMFSATYGVWLSAPLWPLDEEGRPVVGKRGALARAHLALATPDGATAQVVSLSGDTEQIRRRAAFEMIVSLWQKLARGTAEGL